MPRRRDWCRPPSTPHTFERFADLLGSQRREVRVRDRNHSLAALLQLHGSGSDLDLDTAVTRPDLKRLTRFQAQSIAHRLRDDDATRSINGGFHGQKNAIKMAYPQPMYAHRASRIALVSPSSQFHLSLPSAV